MKSKSIQLFPKTRWTEEASQGQKTGWIIMWNIQLGSLSSSSETGGSGHCSIIIFTHRVFIPICVRVCTSWTPS